MDTIEDLRKKLQKLEEKNLELTNQRNQDISRYEKEIMELRLELKREEALCRVLESEMPFPRKEAHMQSCSAEGELRDEKAKLLELQECWGHPRHRTNTISGIDIPSESSQPRFVPQGIRTPCGPAPDARWGEPRHRSYILCGTNITSSVRPYRTYTVSGTDKPSECFCLRFVPKGTTTPCGPVPDKSLRVHFEPEAAGSSPLSAPVSPHDEYFWGCMGHQLAKTPPAHARDSDEYFQQQFMPKGAAAPRGPETDGKSAFQAILVT
ncbi:uncharacterized protein LOC117010467 [Catharus ustulatus]|uniref:uncharacterized protein LOC117010467 n=1 Tax=Catharus ustulatus TaxID=91951 RepID=UPI0014084B57|nr:uncharacterized protein LOC117010467 [Catharus ustulatus]